MQKEHSLGHAKARGVFWNKQDPRQLVQSAIWSLLTFIPCSHEIRFFGKYTIALSRLDWDLLLHLSQSQKWMLGTKKIRFHFSYVNYPLLEWVSSHNFIAFPWVGWQKPFGLIYLWKGACKRLSYDLTFSFTVNVLEVVFSEIWH